MNKFYTIQEFASIVCKSKNLIRRRLTELPKKYEIPSAIKMGGRWLFNKEAVDGSISSGKPLIIKCQIKSGIDSSAVVKYFFNESGSCGED